MSAILNVYEKQQLHRAQLGESISFVLRLAQSGDLLMLKTCLRIIPGKRIVAIAHYNGQAVIAKLFFHKKRSERNFKKEVEGYQALHAAQLPAPKLLLCDQCADDSDIHILVMEQLPVDVTLAQLGRQAPNYPSFDRYVGQFLALLANMHSKGFYQEDCHGDNFLFVNDQFYIIDTAELTTRKSPVAWKKSLKNMADVFSILKITNPGRQALWLRLYLQDRSMLDKKKYFRQMHQAFAERHQKRFVRMMKRLLSMTDKKLSVNKAKRLQLTRDYLSQDYADALVVVTGQTYIMLEDQRVELCYFASSKQLQLAWQGVLWQQFNGLLCPVPIGMVDEKPKGGLHFLAVVSTVKSSC